MFRALLMSFVLAFLASGPIFGQQISPKELPEKELLEKHGDEIAKIWGPLLKQTVDIKGKKTVLKTGFVFRQDFYSKLKGGEEFWIWTESRLQHFHFPQNLGTSVAGIRDDMEKAAQDKYGRSSTELLALLYKYQETRDRYFLTKDEVAAMRTNVDKAIAEAPKGGVSDAQLLRFHSEQGYLKPVWSNVDNGLKLKE